MTEYSEMEANWAPNNRIRLVLPLSNLLLVNWALWTTGAALERDEKWFRELTGLSPAQVRSLDDELMAVRYSLESSPRRLDPRTDDLVPPLEPRKSGTAWDDLLKVEAEKLPDGRIAVTLPQEKLAAFPELLEASLVYVAPYRSEIEESHFRMRFQASINEVEELRDELSSWIGSCA
jgi:hypothetical protein